MLVDLIRSHRLARPIVRAPGADLLRHGAAVDDDGRPAPAPAEPDRRRLPPEAGTGQQDRRVHGQALSGGQRRRVGVGERTVAGGVPVHGRIDLHPPAIGQFHGQARAGEADHPAKVAVDHPQPVVAQPEAQLVADRHRERDRPAGGVAARLDRNVVAAEQPHGAQLAPDRQRERAHLDPGLGDDRDRRPGLARLSPTRRRQRHHARVGRRLDHLAAPAMGRECRPRVPGHDRAHRFPSRRVGLTQDGVDHRRSGLPGQQPHARAGADRLELTPVADADDAAAGLGPHLEQGPGLGRRPLPELVDDDQGIGADRERSGTPTAEQDIGRERGVGRELAPEVAGLAPRDRHRDHLADARSAIALDHRPQQGGLTRPRRPLDQGDTTRRGQDMEGGIPLLPAERRACRRHRRPRRRFGHGRRSGPGRPPGQRTHRDLVLDRRARAEHPLAIRRVGQADDHALGLQAPDQAGKITRRERCRRGLRRHLPQFLLREHAVASHHRAHRLLDLPPRPVPRGRRLVDRPAPELGRRRRCPSRRLGLGPPAAFPPSVRPLAAPQSQRQARRSRRVATGLEALFGGGGDHAGPPLRPLGAQRRGHALDPDELGAVAMALELKPEPLPQLSRQLGAIDRARRHLPAE